ncbi:NADH-cytochrome b5 reductase-like isoform X2 [Colletes gigas]|uniref:NADH-cytochrome b5 reductase-like isoform X2 n=1 Tax=Colletes gigas TaxID=935657 RepID=UPI001C9A7AB6|nr:NADH-cytochrome b5 reductase-like isoform X2 [Colletes gigas]XP_043262657.1 NADH-cytochrome b5 reductase-like isoform X2 [Colletes gigas]
MAHCSSNGENSRPTTPSEEDCCHNACDPCIFDVHEKLLEEYERRKKQNIKVQNRKNLLCSFSYKNFVVINIKETSECYIQLLLKYEENKSKNNISLLINPGQHVMLNLQDKTKPFTPIFWTEDSIQFLIRLYHNGKFSTYLRDIKVGDKIRVRGPYGNFEYKSNSFQNIIMFSMGSGITAVYPIAKSIIDNELEETKIHLIWGFHNILQIPLKKELQILSDYWNFKCTLYISQLHFSDFDPNPKENTRTRNFWYPNTLDDDVHNLHGINIQFGRLNNASVSKLLEDNINNTTLILICGTYEFNRSIEQCSRSMNYTHIHVFE